MRIKMKKSQAEIRRAVNEYESLKSFMNASKQQKLIYQWFEGACKVQPNAIVNAVAGSGKTTTCRIGFSHAPEKHLFYGVFGKKNEIEAREKINDSRLKIKTWHSEGFELVRNNWRYAKLDSEIEEKRLDYVSNGILVGFHEAKAKILKLVEFAKGQFVSPSRGQLEFLAEEMNIYFDGDESDAITLTLAHIEESKNKNLKTGISFIDMVWLPLAMGWTCPKYELVCCDEVQDLCPNQLAIARASVLPSGRMMCVGDSRQTIYGWRGAAQDGMNLMKQELNAREFDLTTSYRCPQAVEKMVQEIVPKFSVHESNPEGEVKTVSSAMDAQPGDAILSRLNAPLMGIALALLRKNIPARIEGRDIGKQIASMIRGFKAKSVPNFFEKVDAWLKKQEQRFSKSKNAAKVLETSEDMAATLKAVAEGCNNVDEIFKRINNLFDDTQSGSRPAVILSSVHKAKGLEWNKVYMLMHTFKKGKTVEESNIYYVAITRARHTLCMVSADHTEPRQPTEHKAELLNA